MDYALGAAFFYAWSVTCARRSSAYHGPDLANLGRLLVAAAVVGLFVALTGRHPFCPGWGWLVLGGVLGLGIGDIALFHALPRIGVGLTMLLTQCLAAPIALLLEYEALGHAPAGAQLLSAAVILLGVGVALGTPAEGDPADRLYGLVVGDARYTLEVRVGTASTVHELRDGLPDVRGVVPAGVQLRGRRPVPNRRHGRLLRHGGQRPLPLRQSALGGAAPPHSPFDRRGEALERRRVLRQEERGLDEFELHHLERACVVAHHVDPRVEHRGSGDRLGGGAVIHRIRGRREPAVRREEAR